MVKKFEDLDIIFGFLHRKAKVVKEGEEGWLVWDSFLYHEIGFVEMDTEAYECIFTSLFESEAEEKFEELLSSCTSKNELISNTPKRKNKSGLNTNKNNELDYLLAELNKLIGLKQLKKDIERYINLVRVQLMREEHGLPQTPASLHLVFTGNPGTGKTTVARLLSKIFYELGILSKGHLIEVDRSGLVAGYIGQTAIQVRDLVEQAKGGILFIDEAYSLVHGGEKDFGREAIDTLVKLMEDNREDLIIIVAGYPKEMEEFISANPGMRSRFNKYIHFEDYNEHELQQIFELRVSDLGFTLSNKAKQRSANLFENLIDQKNRTFGNGREVRNIFEKVIENQATRVVKLKSPSKDDLVMITPEDLELY